MAIILSFEGEIFRPLISANIIQEGKKNVNSYGDEIHNNFSLGLFKSNKKRTEIVILSKQSAPKDTPPEPKKERGERADVGIGPYG